MKTLLQIVVALIVAISSLLAYAIYSPTHTSKMVSVSDRTVSKFLESSKARDYTNAHRMLSNRLQSQLSVPALAQQWKAFESAHGAITQWSSGSKYSINLWPRSVSTNPTVFGLKSSFGSVTVLVRPEGKDWRIDQLTITP